MQTDNYDRNQEELLVSRITDIVETKIASHESRRFRNLYIVISFVSFIGVGVITQLVDFYATKAVESKLHEAKEELDSAKTFAQLLALATKLDLSDSFTHNDRDTIVVLLEKAKNNSKLRSEPAFVSLLEKIIDSFYQSDNSIQVLKVSSMFSEECLSNPGIATTLLQFFGRTYLSETDVDSKHANEIYDYLRQYILALSTNFKGATTAFSILAEFKKNKEIVIESTKSTLKSLNSLNQEQKELFSRTLKVLSNPDRLSKEITPETIRIAHLTNNFINSFTLELSQINGLILPVNLE